MADLRVERGGAVLVGGELRLDGGELRVDARLLAGDVAREGAGRRQERDEAGCEDEQEHEAPSHL